MSVIAELSIPAHEFELGRVLEVESGGTVTLEEVVSLEGTAVPFFAVRNGARDAFEENVRDHPSVEDVRLVSDRDGVARYALRWHPERDPVFEGVREAGAELLSATGSAGSWTLELRFPDHEALSAFREHCDGANVSLDVECVYGPTRPECGPRLGLTRPQRDTLVRAVEAGYYDIPRRVSTRELGDEFGVSDQAVTERLRRAIDGLVENTLAVAGDDDAGRDD